MSDNNYLPLHLGVIFFPPVICLYLHLTSVLDPKHFGTDPDPEFDIRALQIRFMILSFFQHVWRALVLQISNEHKTYKVLYYLFKSKQVNAIIIIL